MTLSSTANKESYTCTGVTAYPFPHYFFADADLVVYREDINGEVTALALTTDYTVTGAGDSDGGTVTTVSTYSDGSLYIVRSVDMTQELDLINNDGFNAETLEDALDKGAMVDQQLKEELDRTLRVSDTAGSLAELPDALAGQALKWNDDGTAIEYFTPYDGSTLIPIQIKQVFSADDGPTVFTLKAGASYTVGTNNVAVYIDGRRQHPGAYTESSATTVTLSEALVEGQEMMLVINDTEVALQDVVTVNNKKEIHVATEGQTVFNLGNLYVLGTGNLAVYIDGLKQDSNAYTETDVNTITFSEPLAAGQSVEVVIGIFEAADGSDFQASITPQSGYVALWDGVNLLLSDLQTMTGSDGMSARLVGRSVANDGGDGWFVWDSSDLSTEVAADTQQGIYVSGGDGSAGAWVRQYDGLVFPSWFGGDLQAASNHALSTRDSVAMVNGQRLSSTLVYKAPLVGFGGTPMVYVDIDDGTPAISLTGSSYHLEGFYLYGQDLNNVGIKTTVPSSWYTIKDITVNRCGSTDPAVEIEGWGGKIDKLITSFNAGDGLKLSQANGAEVYVIAESNEGIGVVIDNSGANTVGLTLRGISEGNTLGGIVADNVVGLTLDRFYWEGNDIFQGKFGTLSKIKELSISGGSLTSTLTANDYGLFFDDVDGLNVDGIYLSDQSNLPITTSTNTKNINKMNIRQQGYGGISDMSKSVGATINHFPNANFDRWLAGWEEFGYPATTTALDSTLGSRRGLNSLGIKSITGQANPYVYFNLSGLESLLEKNVVFGAWVYVPDIVEFTPSNIPYIKMTTSGGNESTSTLIFVKKGNWLFLSNHAVPMPVLITDTYVRLTFYLRSDAGICTGNEYIIVDSVVAGVDTEINFEDAMSGNFTYHPDANVLPSGRLRQFISNGPPDGSSAWSDYVWKIGDTYINDLALTTGDVVEWKCVIDGAYQAGQWIPVSTLP